MTGSGRYLDASAFTRAPEAPNGTSLADQDFGNSSVGIVRGPGQHNLDLAIERLFPVTESSSFRFRTEFFNLTNTPQFANPNNNLGLWRSNASESYGELFVWPDHVDIHQPAHYPVRGEIPFLSGMAAPSVFRAATIHFDHSTGGVA